MSYKDSAFKVLKMEKKPLHCREIVQVAVRKGWLKPKGQTPDLTMNAQLARDIKSKKKKSRFIKTGPSVFSLNKKIKNVKKPSKNPGKIMSENFVKNAIIAWLSKNDWKIVSVKTLSEKGVDIEAQYSKYSRRFLIETKGHGKIKQYNERNFIFSLGQIVTRMKPDAGYYYGLGLPETSAKTALRRLPWKVAKKLGLFVFSVQPDKKTVKYSWKELKAKQENIR